MFLAYQVFQSKLQGFLPHFSPPCPGLCNGTPLDWFNAVEATVQAVEWSLQVGFNTKSLFESSCCSLHYLEQLLCDLVELLLNVEIQVNSTLQQFLFKCLKLLIYANRCLVCLHVKTISSLFIKAWHQRQNWMCLIVSACSCLALRVTGPAI